MIYEVITTDQADADLRGIYEYIAFERFSPDHAAGQLERLEEHIAELKEFPEKFRHYEKEPWRSRGLRVMPVDNYLVFSISSQFPYILCYNITNHNRNLEDDTQ